MLSSVGVNANIVIVIFIVIVLDANRPEREKEGAIKISNGNFKKKFDFLQLAQNHNNGQVFYSKVLTLSVHFLRALCLLDTFIIILLICTVILLLFYISLCCF